MAPDPDEVHLFRCRRTWGLRLSLTGLPRPISSREPRKPPRVAMSMHPNREAERPRRVAESPRRGRCPCLLAINDARRRRRRSHLAGAAGRTSDPGATAEGATAEVAVCAHREGHVPIDV